MAEKSVKGSPPKVQGQPSKTKLENATMQRSVSSVSIHNLLIPWRNKASPLENMETASSMTNSHESIKNLADNASKEQKPQLTPNENVTNTHDTETQDMKPQSNADSNITLEEYREEIRKQSSEHNSIIATQNSTQGNFTWSIWRRDSGVKPVSDNVTTSEPAVSKSTGVILNTEVSPHTTNINTNEPMPWMEWANPVTRIGSVISLVYSPNNYANNEHAGLTPNEISEVISSSNRTHDNLDHNQPPSLHRTTSNRSSLHADHLQQSSWWPWSWGSTNGTSSHSLPVELSVKFSRDTISAVQNQSSYNQKTSSWAYWYHKQVPLDDAKVIKGELAVDGTESSNNPADAETLPISKFESAESQIKPPTDIFQGGTQFTLPDLRMNYRDETIKTNARIFLSKIVPICFERQKHLYHRRRYTCKEQTISSSFENECGKRPISRSKWPRKRAVVIGVHGFLPLKMVKALIGQSTGSAEKYATEAKVALCKWAVSNKVDIDVETIALEGEGKIFERTSDLFGLLENWMSSIATCDYLFFASHSQSVPVSIHIVAKLVALGYLDKVSRIGMINMAGLCLGPIPGLDAKISVKAYTKFENEVLMELFDLQNPETLQSEELIRSLRILVKRNVKLTFIGSLNDQLIPLYSALCLQVDHPNIFRALHVDNESSRWNFLYKLVSHILYLKNLGFDHDRFLVEISRYLYGNVGIGGHSKIFDDESVYLIGIKNTLETSDMFHSPPLREKKIDSKKLNINQYHLPWCLRGLLEELSKLPNIPGKQLISELIADFQAWKPESKLHKEMKYSIEVIEDLQLDDLCH